VILRYFSINEIIFQNGETVILKILRYIMRNLPPICFVFAVKKILASKPFADYAFISM